MRVVPVSKSPTSDPMKDSPRIETSPSVSAAVSRRRFTQMLVAGSGALAFPAIVRGQNLNNRLDVVAIGVGGRGAGNLGDVARTENIVAVCDVAAGPLDAAAAKHPGARRYTDFRKLYDAEKKFDAVIVSTCEHTHAFATLPALRMGKHLSLIHI